MVARVRVPADQRDRAALVHRAWIAIGLCAALPVLIGLLLTDGAAVSPPPAAAPVAGHWVYVPSRGAAVHVDGAAGGVDATVSVGSAGAGSPVLADRHSAYLVDADRVIVFKPGTGVTGDAPAAGVAEDPVPLEAGDTAYLVYRTAGLIVRLGPRPITVSPGGPLGAPVITPAGDLWTHRLDTGDLCRLAEESTLDCPIRTSADHLGALALRDGGPIFVDITAGTWQPFDERAAGEPVSLGVPLPANAAVGAATVAGRLPVVDPAAGRLLLLAPRADAISVPLRPGRFARPVSTAGAVAILNEDTGELATYDSAGQPRATITLAGGARLTPGTDGRVYADSTDGLQTVIMDADGRLTPVRTTADEPPRYPAPTPTPAVSLPPATIAPTTTETVPPAPETVTVQVTPTTQQGAPPATSADPGTTPSPTTSPGTPTNTQPPPSAPAGRPTVDVLRATATGPGEATIQIRVSGAGPVFCHIYLNSVERAATDCSGTMDVVATGLAPDTIYDIYVLGTNAEGTGTPGRRGQLQL